MDELDLVVISPGVPTDLPVVQKMREKKIEIMGEIELAYLCGKGEVLAITGTNGKTTTTALLGEIMKKRFRQCICSGKYWKSLYDCSGRYQGRFCHCGRDEQFSAGDNSHIPPQSIGHFEFDAGSFRQASYHGGIYSGKNEYCCEPDRRSIFVI